MRSKKHLRFWLLILGMILSVLVFEEIADDVFSDPKEGDHESRNPVKKEAFAEQAKKAFKKHKDAIDKLK